MIPVKKSNDFFSSFRITFMFRPGHWPYSVGRGIEQCEQDQRMNVAPDRTIILGQHIVLDHRSLSSIGQKIMIIHT